MTSWHIPLALSGQNADLSLASLTFDPRVSGDYRLPVLLVGVTGTISRSSATHTMTLSHGELYLETLSVQGIPYPELPVTLKAGDEISW